jgi:hypothetical protein
MGSMSDIPDRDRIDADEERMGALLRAVETPAPATLQLRIAELAAGESRGRRHATWRRRRGAPVFAFGLSVVVAAAVVLLLALPGTTGPSAPTVVRTAEVALGAPTAPAPHARLIAAGTRIVFPDWSSRGWPSSGVRHDRIDGRTVTTEFFNSYESGSLGYAIVAGTPLRWGEAGQTRKLDGERYGLMRSGGAELVTWVQDGHTCILASRTAPASALIALAIAQEHARAA